MIVPIRIKTLIPDISDARLQHAVAFAVNAMRETRDSYREPVSLYEVALATDDALLFTVRGLHTNNVVEYRMDWLNVHADEIPDSV